jgi:hypothetical protein
MAHPPTAETTCAASIDDARGRVRRRKRSRSENVWTTLTDVIGDVSNDARPAAAVSLTPLRAASRDAAETLDRTRSAHPLTTAETTPVGAWGDESGDGPDDAPSTHRRRQRRRPRARIDDAHSPATSARDHRSGDAPEDPLATQPATVLFPYSVDLRPPITDLKLISPPPVPAPPAAPLAGPACYPRVRALDPRIPT